jgi:hypothetical protein
MKHEFKAIPKEEVLSNRSNAYEFINFDKQETLEEVVKFAEKASKEFNRCFDCEWTACENHKICLKDKIR